MGTLVPDDYLLSSLKNDAERMVAQVLCDRLTDGWIVMPSVALSGDRDYEIDVVIAHERDGIAVIEVKGHRPTIRGGVWYAGGQAMDPQPFDQARTNAYELRNRIRDVHPSLRQVRVEYAVAFPNVSTITGSLPPDIDVSQILTCSDLEDCAEAVERLMTYRWGQQPLGQIGVQAVIDLLRPNAELRWEPETRARLARLRLETICDQQVHALQALDINRRVCVTGAAGTGKTRVAVAWVHRAQLRGERVLFTCFNIPLAAMLRSRFLETAELRIGPFHEIALSLDGMPELEVPDDADQQWWDGTELDHLESHWSDVTERFDTIVIDEAQDFNPAWITLLAQLLDDNGPRRVLMVADESQGIYARGFHLPSVDDGWTLCERRSRRRRPRWSGGSRSRRAEGAGGDVHGFGAGPVTRSNGLRCLGAPRSDGDLVRERPPSQGPRIRPRDPCRPRQRGE